MEADINKSLQLTEDAIGSKVKELAFEALFKNLPIAFYWMDKNGYFLGCNDVELKLHNLSSMSQFVGKHSDEVYQHPEGDTLPPSAWKSSKEVIEKNQTMTMEEVQIKPNGEKIYYLSVKSPIHDAAGNAIGLLGIAIDITDRKKMEAELRIAKENAEAADRAKTQFLAVASHELRIPLTGILGLVSFLKQGGLEPSEEREYLEHIDNCSTHLLAIVNDVLDFAKLEAEQFQLSSIPLDLKSLIEEVATMFTASAKSKGLDLLVSFAPSTPNYIMADSRALRQILVNLVSNAIKFTERGYLLIKVHCLQQTSKTVQLEIMVQDTGRGIPADKLGMIFEKFLQVDDAYTRDTSKSGTGLGLAIVKKLAELMGANIRVTSEVGKGSSFYLSAEFPLRSEVLTKSPWFAHAANAKILIVDDTPRGEVLCNNLGSVNCDAVTSADAVNELVSAQHLGQAYHIIIIDQHIQHQNAMDLLKKIQKQTHLPKLLPILLVANNSNQEQAAALEAGFFDTISKLSQPIAFQAVLTSAWERWKELQDKNDSVAMTIKKVLLIEDDQVVQLVHVRMLSDFNCQVDIAATGKEALELYQHNHYDIVFIDIGLPDITGYEVIAQIRQGNRAESGAIPLIALTGYTGDDERQNCLLAGANAVVNKPITPEALRGLLVKYTKQS